MKRTSVTLTLGLLAALHCPMLRAGPGAAPGKAGDASVTLAVLPFDLAPGTDDGRADLLTDLVTAGLAEHFPVVERARLGKALAEQELSLRGLVAADRAVGVGKLVGARL